MTEQLEKLIELCGKNIKLVLGAGIALVLVAASAAALNYKKKSEESAAFAELAKIEKEFNQWKEAKIKVEPEPLYKNLSDFVQSKASLQAGRLAALMATEVGVSLSKESELLQLFESSFKKNDDQLLTGLAVLKKGDLQANQEKCDEALKTWEGLLKKKHLQFLSELAHLKSGLCEEKLNQKDKAISHYDAILKAKDEKSDRWSYKEAQKYKRALQWSKN